MYILCIGTRVASSVVTNRRVIEYKYKNKTCSAWIDLPPSRRRDFIVASGFWFEPHTLRIEPEPTGGRTHPVLHYVVEQTFLSKFCSYQIMLGQPVVQLEAGDHRDPPLAIRLICVHFRLLLGFKPRYWSTRDPWSTCARTKHVQLGYIYKIAEGGTRDPPVGSCSIPRLWGFSCNMYTNSAYCCSISVDPCCFLIGFQNLTSTYPALRHKQHWITVAYIHM